MPRRKGADIDFLEYQLFRIGRGLEKLFGKVEEMGEGQDALQASADEAKAAVDNTVTVIESLITKLQSQPNAPDFTSEVQALQGISDELTGAKSAPDAAEQSAEVGAVPGAGEAPPEPPPTGQ